MNRKSGTIIWIIAFAALLIAAYTFYGNNKAKSGVPSEKQTTVRQDTANASAAGKTGSPESSSGNEAGEDDKIMAPDFTLKDMDGNDVKLSDYRGKIVILNFWAVWCRYCKEEMPDFNEMNKELEKENDTVILTVNVQESHDTIRKYLDSNNINLKVLEDGDGSIARMYGINGLPNTFIINMDGSLYTYIPGKTDKETLRSLLDKARDDEPPM